MVDFKIEADRYNDRGADCIDAGLFDQMKLNYSRFFKLSRRNDRDSASLYLLWASNHYERRKYSQTIRKCRLALQYGYYLSDLYNGWGSSLSNLGKFDEAIIKFNQALEINSKDTLARLNRVLALFLKKDNEEALKYFEDAKKRPEWTRKKAQMKMIYQREMESLDLRISEATDSSEVLLGKERQLCVQHLINLLDEK